MWAKQKQTGFTIVELLIVIVVIAILATIVIVAYTGITQNARVSTLQSDLQSSYNVLSNDNTTTGTYPATLSAANSGRGLTPTNGNTYSYTVSNNISPAYFCLAETNTASSLTYFVTSTSNAPQVGGCSVTNLAANPSSETDGTNWYNWAGTNGVVAQTRQTSGGYSGSDSTRVTWTTATTSPSGGMLARANAIVPGTTYTASIYFRTNSTRQVQIEIKYVDSSDTALLYTGYIVATSTTSWQRLSYTSVAPANSSSVLVDIISTGSSPNWAVGDYIEGDALMVTQGSTLYNYADGNSSNWIWNGAVNDSSSTGSPL